VAERSIAHDLKSCVIARLPRVRIPPSPPMKIVKVTLDDVAGLAMVAEVMGYEVDEAGVRERVKKILERQDHCLLVAKEGDEVIGFCHGYVRLLVEVGEAVEIGGLAVKEEHQGKGVAKQLIVAMEAWVSEIGQDWVVLSSNVMRVKVHGFYEHMGYEKSRQQFAFEKRLN
jgi:GNAT superfamily N-acetyltransferase